MNTTGRVVPKFLAGHAHFYMPLPLINRDHFCTFFLHERLFEVEGGEMVVTGGEMVVTGGGMVVTGRELDGGDWRRDGGDWKRARWW